MGRRKYHYKPQIFESAGVPNDTSANIYESMLTSPAFQHLTKNQRLLYVYMKAQYYGKRKPSQDFPEMSHLQGRDLFYFNRSIAVNKYGLYSDNNRKSFYDDIKAVEQHGFIKTISNGRATRRKSIYQFSGDWRNWKGSS